MPEEKKKRRIIRTVLAICLIALVVILAVQNIKPVELQLLFWKQSISAAILLPVIFLLGVFAGRYIR